jgi:hypothetical protein
MNVRPTLKLPLHTMVTFSKDGELYEGRIVGWCKRDGVDYYDVMTLMSWTIHHNINHAHNIARAARAA